MPIDLTAISPAAKAKYIRTGERWGSELTLAQADHHIGNLPAYGALLAKFGFGLKDGQKLTDARDGLLGAGVQRTSAVVGGTKKRLDVAEAIGVGKDERATARSVLLTTRAALFESAAPDDAAAVKAIDGVLAKTSLAGGDPTELGNQLGVLEEALANPTVAAAAKERGGAEALAAVQAAKAKVKGTPSVVKRGTPAETELLNLYDGMIVELCRAARRAARAAAKKTGQPAIAKLFELNHLNRSGGAEEEPEPGAGGGGEAGGEPKGGAGAETKPAVKPQ